MDEDVKKMGYDVKPDETGSPFLQDAAIVVTLKSRNSLTASGIYIHLFSPATLLTIFYYVIFSNLSVSRIATWLLFLNLKPTSP
jgi:hypothetical protein